MKEQDIRTRVAKVKEYFDGTGYELHDTVWGDDLHLGFPPNETSSLEEAAEHTNELMAKAVSLGPRMRVLDLGCGYGSTARFLAAKYGCQSTGITISDKEVAEARRRAKESGMESLLRFEQGDFHDLSFTDASFEVVWSQDSLMYGADKTKILKEARRVLVPGGNLVFTDILASRDTPEQDRTRLYARVNTPEMWNIQRYREALEGLGFDIQRVEDWSKHVARSYALVRDRVKERRAVLADKIGEEAVQRTIDGLTFWVDSAGAGYVGWAFFVAHKS